MSNPLVSVIIPTYNSANYVTNAVDSVLAQTFTDLEVIVVDDGSTDDTREALSRYAAPVRYLHQDNAGVSVARNLGIAESRGRYVAFLDADDTWMAHKLERQLQALDNSHEMGVSYSAHLVVDDVLRPVAVHGSQRWSSALEDLLYKGNVVGSICTVLVEHSLLKQVGGFDPELSQCADWDMWIRLARHTEFLYIDEPLVTYRQHDNNMSRGIPLLEKDSLRVLEKGFSHAATPDKLRARAGRAFGRQWMVVAGSYFQAGRYFDFLRCTAHALSLDPRQCVRLADYPLRQLRRIRRSMRCASDGV